ncbi:hypothetical protein GY631_3506 [Trichophyton interdigitale]|uniref:Endosomal peripheral membrane protein n=1 Tax=Trichophyton interdigitale TaxID=101480 RepID=A0A9P4YHC0_9EURO|nr:hypothetical protein GY631_3506 [Trichophyton interdigitale]KAF3894466.1 hypothetical protein GY632_3750 [Trichophyton interdigitale]
MTSNNLQAELSNLIQESKRKHSDLKNAAEQSLAELKALPSTSESQLAADLARKPQFARPFILACHTKHTRLAAIGVTNLQRLVTIGALPHERLKDVLQGLHETANLSLEIQLKILQTLPSLFRFYADNLTGTLLASTLEICATLQNSKTTAVSNTAAATLQQLVIAVFEKVSQEDSKNDSDASYTTISVEGQKLEVSTFSYDAFRILEDLCRLLEGEQLTYLNIKSLSKIFILELIESILVNNTAIFTNHPEHTQVLRHRLLPLAVRYLSERQSFSLTVRVARIALYILKAHLSLLTVECEVILSLLIHLIDTETSLPWKRVLCMEIFRSLYTEPGIIRLMYTLFDKEEGRKAVLRDHMSCLVRLSSEKSSLIGLGHQSTIPLAPQAGKDTMEDQVALESVGVSGIIGSPSNKSEMCGISTQWSLLRVPYIETLDKVDSPSPPDTYIYSLVLNCIAAFSESMAKFIIPLAVAESKSKRKRNTSSSDKERSSSQQGAGRKESTGRSSIPPNPLELNSHPQFTDIQATAGIIEVCWPAILATSSTFLYAALDGEFYHTLVRAFQKLAHVAGLLRLATPRDAFLTTLGKAAVPTDLPGPNPDGSTVNSPIIDNTNQRSSVSDTANSPVDSPIHMLNTRNLLCLRALLNLGIALGPTLDRDAWSIILETLQNAELVINATSSTFVSMPTDPAQEAKNLNSDTPKSNLGPEIVAVQAVTNKLCESTSDYTDSAFKIFLMTLLNLPESFTKESVTPSSQKQPPPLLTQGQNGGRVHQNKRSLSVALGRNRVREDELKFVLEKAHAVAKANIERLSLSEDQGIWELLVNNLLKMIQNDQISSALRLKASDVTNTVISNSIKLTESTEEESRNSVQLRGLHALKSQSSMPFHGRRPSSSSRAVDLEVHEFALETLKSILEGSGQSVVAGWNLVFELISSVFDNEIPPLTETGENGLKPNVLPGGVLSNTLERLTSPIFGKYKWLGKDSSPPLWQTATTASLDLIEIAVGYVEAQYSTCDRTITERFWASVVEVVKAVVSCGEYADLNLTPSTVLSDEQFDIAAFERLRGMVIPALGSSFVSPKIRRDFAFVLFNSSHVYPPQRLDLPDNSAQKEPLRDLYKVRRGRTHGPQPTMRSKLSYVLVDTLFDLASVRNPAAGESQASSSNFVTPYISLAKSVSPYLILRCALPLKSYIADQPLLGLMPQPIISRKELMYLLTRLVDLKSEPTAIPAAGPSVPIGEPNDSPDDEEEEDEESGPSTTARFKKHLGWMYPLVIRAITVAGKESKDRQVLDALTKVLEGIQG